MYSVLWSNQTLAVTPNIHQTSPLLAMLSPLPECPVTSSHDNAISDINTQLKCYLPSEPFPDPSTRYNPVSHFIKAHLLSNYYVPNWLEGPDGGRGRKQDKKDTIFAFKGTVCYVGVSEHAHTHTYRIQRKN